MLFRYETCESYISIHVWNIMRQSTSESSMTQPKPVTDRIVSINDQVFNVWPTVMPKYSLTSQNPASFRV